MRFVVNILSSMVICVFFTTGNSIYHRSGSIPHPSGHLSRTAGGAPAPYSPTNGGPAGLTQWYDGYDTNTVVTSTGQYTNRAPISTWLDKSPYTNMLIQPSAAQQFLYITETNPASLRNGLVCGVWGCGDRWMYVHTNGIASLESTNALSGIFVMRNRGSGDIALLNRVTAADSLEYMFWYGFTVADSLAMYDSATWRYSPANVYPYVAPEHIYRVLGFSYGGTNISFYTNGVFAGSSAILPNKNSGTGYTIINNHYPYKAGTRIGADVYWEILVYSNTLTAADHSMLTTNYLYPKWGTNLFYYTP